MTCDKQYVMIKFVLVLISLSGMEAKVEGTWEFADMFECFSAREQLSTALGSSNGYFPEGYQAVCMPQTVEQN